MKFVIEPINLTDCRIVDIDCTALRGARVNELTLPPTVTEGGKTWRVTEVGHPWQEYGVCHAAIESPAAKFASLGNLHKLVISEGIERIYRLMGDRGNGETLTQVVLPASLKVIGQFAFYGCEALLYVNIPDGVEEIGECAFSGCTSLSPFQWPGSLRKVCLSAFSFTRKANSDFVLHIPAAIEIISGLTTMQVPHCVVPLQAWRVFSRSDLLRQIDDLCIPEGVTKIEGDGYKQLKRVSLPSTLEEIGDETFADSGVLDHLTELPESLRKVGAKAFHNATKHEGHELRILSPRIAIGPGAFACEMDKRIKLVGTPEVMTAIMAQPGALNGTMAEEITLPPGVTELNVRDCTNLRSLTVPESVETVHALRNVSAEIHAPLSVWQGICASEWGLYGYTPATHTLVIPEGVERLGASALQRANLTKISLPDSLTEIAWNCFAECRRLRSLRIPANVKHLGRDFIRSCNSLVSLTFAEESALKTIGEDCISNAVRLRTVVLPHGVNRVGSRSFNSCPSLESITFPASVKSYGLDVVNDCKLLRHAIFLADDPATARYPWRLGASVDWYVPDHMVDHVKALKSDARSIRPLSQLAADTESKPTRTNPYTVYSTRLMARYAFAVNDADLEQLRSPINRAVLAMKYLRHKLDECAFSIRFHSDGFYSDLERGGKMPGNFCTPDDYVDGPSPQAAFEAQCPAWGRALPSGAKMYLRLGIGFKVRFVIKLAPGERPDPLKIAVHHDWTQGRRFALYYDGEYVPASAVEGSSGPEEFLIGAFVFSDPECLHEVRMSNSETVIHPKYYRGPNLPIIDNLLSYINGKN